MLDFGEDLNMRTYLRGAFSLHEHHQSRIVKAKMALLWLFLLFLFAAPIPSSAQDFCYYYPASPGCGNNCPEKGCPSKFSTTQGTCRWSDVSNTDGIEDEIWYCECKP